MPDASGAQHIWMSTAGLVVSPEQMALYVHHAHLYAADVRHRDLTFEFARIKLDAGGIGLFVTEDYASGLMVQNLNACWIDGPLPREVLNHILLTAFPVNLKAYSHIAQRPRLTDPTERIQVRPNWGWMR